MMSVPTAPTTVVVGVCGVVVDLVEVRAQVSAAVTAAVTAETAETAEVTAEVSAGLRRGRRGAPIAVPEAGRIGKASAVGRC